MATVPSRRYRSLVGCGTVNNLCSYLCYFVYVIQFPVWQSQITIYLTYAAQCQIPVITGYDIEQIEADTANSMIYTRKVIPEYPVFCAVNSLHKIHATQFSILSSSAHCSVSNVQPEFVETSPWEVRAELVSRNRLATMEPRWYHYRKYFYLIVIWWPPDSYLVPTRCYLMGTR